MADKPEIVRNMKKLIALKDQRFGNDRLAPGDPFEANGTVARTLVAIGRAAYAPEPVAERDPLPGEFVPNTATVPTKSAPAPAADAPPPAAATGAGAQLPDDAGAPPPADATTTSAAETKSPDGETPAQSGETPATTDDAAAAPPPATSTAESDEKPAADAAAAPAEAPASSAVGAMTTETVGTKPRRARGQA